MKNLSDLDSDIKRIEQRLAAGRVKTQHDWSALTQTVSRKTSWVPLAAGAAGIVLFLLATRKPAPPEMYAPVRGQWRALPPVKLRRRASLLGALASMLRLASSPPAIALMRSMRSRRA